MGLTLTAVFYSGDTSTLSLSTSTKPHVTAEFTPPFIAKLQVRPDTAGIYPTSEVIFVPTCTPAHPFYVRWINRDGGFEYYMFDQRKVFEGSAGGAVEFTPEIEFTPETSRTREVLDMTECKETATVGEEQLERDMFDMLKGLIYSPRIDRWNPATEQWEGLTHDSTATAAWDTKTSLGMVEFTFRLNEIQLQF